MPCSGCFVGHPSRSHSSQVVGNDFAEHSVERTGGSLNGLKSSGILSLWVAGHHQSAASKFVRSAPSTRHLLPRFCSRGTPILPMSLPRSGCRCAGSSLSTNLPAICFCALPASSPRQRARRRRCSFADRESAQLQQLELTAALLLASIESLVVRSFYYASAGVSESRPMSRRSQRTSGTFGCARICHGSKCISASPAKTVSACS